MTNITVRMRNGEMEIYAVGHAEDVAVCSSISAILETAVLGLQAVAETHPDRVSIEIKDLSPPKIF